MLRRNEIAAAGGFGQWHGASIWCGKGNYYDNTIVETVFKIIKAE